MKHRLNKGIVAVTAHLLARFDHARAQVREDRGDVVSTLIMVAGFAALAVLFVLAVSAKVRGWITKIPNP